MTVVHQWLAHPLPSDVERSIQRLASQPDVRHVAVMPDVHLAEDVCVGVAVATSSRLLPDAVGGDVGCGMAAIRFQAEATLLSTPQQAARLLQQLYAHIPAIKHAQPLALPSVVTQQLLSAHSLQALLEHDGRVEFSTLGRGNHFLEFQADGEGALWLMVHSGSRALGPAIRAHHRRAATDEGAIPWLLADSPQGRAYLQDVDVALAYARESRRAMVSRVEDIARRLWGVSTDESSFLDCHHNHVRLEAGQWVHRKGAMDAGEGVRGIIPGSMGSRSHHVEGRGNVDALCSCSHGAGRAMSRTDARKRISVRMLERQMEGVFFDHRHVDKLRDEAPGAYKDITRVMRAQQDLVKITATLTPLLSYKGT